MADEPKKRGRPRRQDGPTGRIVANVNLELHERFAQTAYRLGRVQRNCLEEAIRDWLLKYGDTGLLKKSAFEAEEK